MIHNFTIPDFLSHLKVDERGYPIPYFVTYIDGKPDFRLYDAKKWETCMQYDKCAVCGKKNIPGTYFFIGGPLSSMNQVSSDNAMHRKCAEFSLRACPHLYLQKAERNERGEIYKAMEQNNPNLHPDKPKEIYLIKADKYSALRIGRQKLIKFRKVSEEIYSYSNGTLSKN